MRKIVFIGIFGFALLAPYADAIEISGFIKDELGNGIPNTQIMLGSKTMVASQSGKFQFELNQQEYYSFTFSKAGFYTMVHSFSAQELTSNGTNSKQNIPTITLVAKAKDRTMFAFGGDVMMGRRFNKPYFEDSILIAKQTAEQDTKDVVKHMKPYMSLADFAVVNLETQIAANEPAAKAPKSVTFYSPPETLKALSWAGIDYVTLGNNHTYDYLDSGLKSTIEYLEKSTLKYSGAGLNETAALSPYVASLADSNYAMLGYVGWEGSARPTQTADSKKGGAAYGSMDNILASVTSSTDKGLLPIVQYHGSLEYKDEPSGVTEQRLKSAIDAGAILAIGHHPHVAQGFEVYNGKLIAYSMGNFIFDQYFYSTHHSFVLYVWMDGEKFHRAEIVPLYVKGYKPTPALGTNRYSTLKRLSTLSAQRATKLDVSGGHAVISSSKSKPQNKVVSITKQLENKKLIPISDVPWQSQLKQISVPNNTRYRLGTSLTNGGNFENHSSFESNQRGWLFDAQSHSIIKEGENNALALRKNSKPAWFGMQNFRRVYKPSNPMSLAFKVKADKPVTLTLYWQGRKTRDKFFAALDSADKHLIGTFSYTSKDWQEIVAEFNSPRIGYRSYRILMELDGQPQTILIDDVDLVEWQTAYTTESTPPRLNTLAEQASFIGFNQAVSGQLELNVEL